jgi:hypothetical protein
MPEIEADRKSPKRWLIAPYILAAVLAAGWCGWWFYGAGRVQQQMDVQAKALAAQGITLHWQNRKVVGFPYRYIISLDDVSVREPNGWAVSTPHLELMAVAYNLGVWNIASDKPVTFARTDGSKTFAVSGDVMDMSISHFHDTPPKIAVEGVKLKLSGASAFATIDRFELHLAPAANQTAAFSLRIDKAQAAPDTLLARIADGKGVIIGLEGDLTSANGLKGSGFKESVRNWAAAGGGLNIKQGGIQAGEALLSLKPSTVFAATDGSLRGELGLSLTSASQAVLAMGAVGALPPETAAVASGAASATQIFTKPGKPIEATFVFRDGKTLLGPLPLGPAPKLFQP